MNFTNRVRVLICSGDEQAAGFMQSALGALSQYDSELAPLASLTGDKRTLAPADFDLFILDVEDGTMLENPAVQELRRQSPNTPLIVVSEALSDQRMRLLFRLNGNDWLRKPLERKSLLESISTHAQMANSGGNHVHAVMSAVGGAGATSIASSLADALVRSSKKDVSTVALFDLDFSTGASGHYLNLTNDYDLQPVLDNPSRVDLEFIDIIKKQHQRGFSLLSFRKPDVLLSPQGTELVLRMLDVVSFQNNHTVLDMPYYETPWKGEIISAVNTIYLVTDLTIPGLHQAKLLYERIKSVRGDASIVNVVANKYRRRLFAFGVGRKDTKKVFTQTKAIIIEDDWSTLSEAINRGVLPVEVGARSKFVRQVEKMAELVQ